MKKEEPRKRLLKEIAKEIGISPSHLTRVLQGEKRINEAQYRRLVCFIDFEPGTKVKSATYYQIPKNVVYVVR